MVGQDRMSGGTALCCSNFRQSGRTATPVPELGRLMHVESTGVSSKGSSSQTDDSNLSGDRQPRSARGDAGHRLRDRSCAHHRRRRQGSRAIAKRRLPVGSGQASAGGCAKRSSGESSRAGASHLGTRDRDRSGRDDVSQARQSEGSTARCGRFGRQRPGHRDRTAPQDQCPTDVPAAGSFCGHLAQGRTAIALAAARAVTTNGNRDHSRSYGMCIARSTFRRFRTLRASSGRARGAKRGANCCPSVPRA